MIPALVGFGDPCRSCQSPPPLLVGFADLAKDPPPPPLLVGFADLAKDPPTPLLLVGFADLAKDPAFGKVSVGPILTSPLGPARCNTL